MDPHWISRRYQKADFPPPLDLEDKIKVFKDRVEGWQLRIGRSCYRRIPHGGFGALYVVLSYFEMIGRYKEGSTGHQKAGKWFRKGFRDFSQSTGFSASPNYQAVERAMYEGGRCGLYHMGMTSKNVYIGGGRGTTFDYDPARKRLVIDPGKLIDELLTHFRSYILALKNPANAKLRTDFEHKFDHDIGSQLV